jgi:plastocyanin
VTRTTQAAVAAALCSLALPPVAGAANKTVLAGPAPGKPPAGVPKDASVNRFLPDSIKVRAGQPLSFQITGCPSVAVSRPGDVPQFVVDDATRTIAGVNDAAGAALWFDGAKQPIANPGVFLGVKSGARFAGKAIASGFPAGPGAPKPWKVTFPTPGTYTMSCPIFPGMTGKITVVGARAAVPSPAADAQRVKAQLADAIKNVKRIAAAPAPAGDVITTGPDAGTGELLYRFTPAKKAVAVGTPVTLKMGEGTREYHTFTFFTDQKATETLAKNSLAPLPGTGKTGPPIMGIDPLAGLRSEPAGTALTDDGTAHGNGYVNTGLLDTDPKSRFPDHDSITFTKAGTYKYLCLLHPEMQGEITVSSAA